MIDITLALLGIVILFAIFVTFRTLSPIKICALCGAVSIIWIILLTLFYLGYETDPVLLGILMGGSAVGLIYLLEQKLPEKYQLFKLPFFLMLIVLSYLAIEKNLPGGVITLVVLVWLLTTAIHTSRNVKNVKILGEKIIKCCKNW